MALPPTPIRHVINKKYYKAMRSVKPEGEEEEPELKQTVPVRILLLVPVCFWSIFNDWLLRQKRKPKTPKFVPFPKSLLWPTPLFFTVRATAGTDNLQRREDFDALAS